MLTSQGTVVPSQEITLLPEFQVNSFGSEKFIPGVNFEKVKSSP